MNDNNELVEATISYMNTMPPLPHNQPPPQQHNTVSPASRHEGQQHHYNNRQQQRTSHHHQFQQQQYHPYARPPQTNTPYNQEYGGYEGYYQNNIKMSYPMPPRQQQQHQVSTHEGSPYPQYQSSMPPYHQANSMMMQQQRQPPTIITTTKSPSLSSPTSLSSTKSKSSKSKSKSKLLASQSKVKKPPRSYTEYNIFFQLERERILGNLIEEQEKKQNGEGESGGGKGDESCENGGEKKEEGVRDEKDKEVAEDTNNKDNTSKEEDDEDKPYPTIDSKGRQLNIPSDSNDILPRPPRFAHLQLSPLWYDSTHRLAESKRNKAKRKHRKTHGLVGFLELTKMIAKEWKVVDSITKSYCKCVADRQLILYKEEMKEVKKKQLAEEQELLLNVVGDNTCGGNSKSKNKKQKKDERTPMQLQQMLRIQESTAPKLEVVVKYDNNDAGRYPHQEYRDNQGGTVRHSYPPPPPSQYWSPRFAQQQQQVQGPPPQFRNEREGPSGYSQRSIPQGYHHQQHGHQGRPSSNRQQQHYSPPPSNLPPLTPDSQLPMNGVSSSGNNNGNLLTPLDELNRRRALYGAQAAAIEAKSKFRSPGTSRLERAMRGQGGGPSTTSVNNRALISGKIQQDKVTSASYLSPADQGGVAMSAVTPSPSRRTAGLVIGASPDASSESNTPASSTSDKGAATSPPSNTVDGSMTPSQLPMKKRRKKLLEENSEVDIDSDIKNKDTTTTNKPGLPIRHSSVNSVGGFLSSPGFGFQLSPGSMGMMTPGGNGNGTFGSPSQYHKALVGPYLNDNTDGGVKSSPFPYIDWSPQESSPQDATKEQQGGKPSLATRDHSRGVVPPHLGVPGGYHHGHGHHPIQYRHPGNMLGPHNGMSPGIGFADEGALDLDEEEMKLMWSKMATTAKRKRVASRDQAAAWMYGQYGPMGSFAAASPGGGGMMSWAHSFSSPGNLGGRPDILARRMSNGSVMKKEETASTDAESNSEEKKEEAEKKTELPSLTEV